MAGKQHLSLLDLYALFPTEDAARDWFTDTRWPQGRYCPKCGSTKTTTHLHNTLPYWCPTCRRRFSVTSGTALERTRMPLQKWGLAIYLFVTNLKGISSLRLHRELGISKSSAWFVLHRLRVAFDTPGPLLPGPVEVDETYIGGRWKSMSRGRRAKMRALVKGRGGVGKTPVVGLKDQPSREIRAAVVTDVKRRTLHGFLHAHVQPGASVYTDEHRAYKGMPFDHHTVNHSVNEYVRDQITTNGIESFWATLKRAQWGTYHHLSAKHLQRYVHEFAGRHNIRDKDTVEQMTHIVANLVGKRLMYRDLIDKS